MSGIAAPAFLRPERSRRDTLLWIAVGVSLLVHVVLFAILSLLRPSPPPPAPAPMDVTIADDVGLTAGAPNTTVDPAESKAPEIDKPEDAAPPPPAPTPEKAEPAPPKPQPEAAPPPKPAAVAKPQPKTIAPPAPKTAKAPTKPAVAAPAKPAPTPGKGTGKTGTKLTRPTGLIFGNDYFKGASTKPSNATSDAPKSATMSQAALMDIGQKIKQRVQPCANRQVNPAPGYAEDITVVVNLKINRDGSLNGRPRVIGHRGVTDANTRYVSAVNDRAIATFMGCAPLTGLPQELYAVPRGWSDFNTTFKLPG